MAGCRRVTAALQRVVVAAPSYPWPANDGGRIGLVYRLRGLHALGVEVHFLCTPKAGDPTGPSPLDGWCASVRSMVRPPARAVAWHRPADPYQATSRDQPVVRAALASLCAAVRPQVVLLEHTYMGGLRHAVPSAIPVVIGVHNVEAEALRARATSIGMLSPRAVPYWLESVRMARFERRLLADRTLAGWIFVSDDERARTVARLPYLADRAWTVPPGTDLPTTAPRPAMDDGCYLFVGSLWYDPNVEGLRWFTTHVWPAVRAEQPDAVLVIAGRQPSAALADEMRRVPGVEFLGEVPEVDPLYRRARVVVLPVRHGAGVKVKTVEALGRGVPCIGTHHAFEGLGADPRTLALVADDPSALAQAAVRAFRGDPEVMAIAEHALRFVRASFTWDAVSRTFHDILATVAARA